MILPSIIINIITQLTALFLGIIAGVIVSWLAQEELKLYRNIIGNAARIVFMLTLLLQLLFTENFIIVGLIAGTYCIFGIWQQKEVQVFFLVAPFAAILCSASSTGFLTVLTGILIATLLSTTLLLAEYTKNQKVQWNRNMWIDGAKVYVPFILLSSICYILFSQNYFYF